MVLQKSAFYIFTCIWSELLLEHVHLDQVLSNLPALELLTPP